MNFTITDSAASLYKKEIPLSDGETIRLYVRVGGIGSGGFSVGVMKEQPSDTSFKVKKQGITFFVNEDDFWYLDDMTIDYNEDTGYLDFINPRFSQLDHPENH
ncbi:HesB/YadR/YfhF family protein [Halalkalibacter krulwichiae]|uniref:Iron-sulfur cluster insertion protein ErpA n=1 Tax=Halalkalibacter krulwichiae TaxID=199441 RepID=A0A1X9MAG0_9BACI|nr:HesB/YadR/YfhF family protein [Halalkalibacter krulwichiae]ARK30415.1 Iron-sulfur cluster insertion protein ErpA [Halalkalibacter krulwichiae]